MTSRHIRIGFCLLAIQIVLLAVTLGFHATMDRQAERSGISTIIEEASR